jgi:membrane protein DedA with SNARE-associated domain
MPFAGIARVPPWRALLPLALASAVYYGALTFLVTTLGTNLETVMRVVGRANVVLAVVAAALLLAAAIWTLRRLKR